MEEKNMPTMSYKHWIALLILLTIGVILIAAFLTAPSFDLIQQMERERIAESQSEEDDSNAEKQNVISIGVYTTEKSEIDISENLVPRTESLPGFISIQDTKLVISPGKYDLGTYEVVFDDRNDLAGESVIYEIEVSRELYSTDKLNQIVTEILGNQLSVYGVRVIDLLSDTRSGVNIESVLLPGSLAKVPVVILALRDIDSGKISFDDDVVIQQHLKHSQTDDVGKLPAGSMIKVRDLIELTIIQSNNSAMYHLRDYIGGVGEVDQRTRSELHVSTFHDAYSHAAIARNVGKVFEDLYDGKLLSTELTDYMIDLMKRPYSHLREGIPYALSDEGVEVANKVGFLYGGLDNCYVDAAIVYGQKTDYVLVVLNQQTSVENGKVMIRRITDAVHDFLN